MDLNKDRSAYKAALQPGEPWTFVSPEINRGNTPLSIGGVVSDWWFTDEPARLFKITAVYADALETVFIGFAKEPGSFEVG